MSQDSLHAADGDESQHYLVREGVALRLSHDHTSRLEGTGVYMNQWLVSDKKRNWQSRARRGRQCTGYIEDTEVVNKGTVFS